MFHLHAAASLKMGTPATERLSVLQGWRPWLDLSRAKVVLAAALARPNDHSSASLFHVSASVVTLSIIYPLYPQHRKESRIILYFLLSSIHPRLCRLRRISLVAALAFSAFTPVMVAEFACCFVC